MQNNQFNKTSAPLIKIDRIIKSYKQHTALKGITADIYPGEFLALLGPNGAGKTTLFKLILSLITPTDGTITINNNNPVSIGYLPESVAFYDTMTGREILEFYAKLKRVPLSQCDNLLEQVELLEAADRRVRTYSKGMRQRLGLAQALIGKPDLLLLDEPTTGLDPHLRRRFFGIIKKLREQGITIIVSSHGLSEIEAHADRYLILQQGNMVAQGSLAELKKQTQLPIRIKVSVPAGQASDIAETLQPGTSLKYVNDAHLELNCLEEDKSEVIQTITALGPLVQDLEIHPPRLDDIYAVLTSERNNNE